MHGKLTGAGGGGFAFAPIPAATPETKVNIFTLSMKYFYKVQGESKKSGISKNVAITALKSIRWGKVGVFWKIQLKCCRIGIKPFKVGGKMA